MTNETRVETELNESGAITSRDHMVPKAQSLHGAKRKKRKQCRQQSWLARAAQQICSLAISFVQVGICFLVFLGAWIVLYAYVTGAYG